MGLQTIHSGDTRGTGIRLVAMDNIFEELCISNVFLLSGVHCGHNPSGGDTKDVGLSTSVKKR